MRMQTLKFPHFRAVYLALTVSFLFLASAALASAASLGVSPATGVYQANGTFSVNVFVNTDGQSVNAAEGTLSFNPNQLSVVAVNRSSSIFNLWVTEPTFSNSAGTISFSGGLPSGYTGSRGTIMTVTFRTAGAGTARVQFSNGSVLANDGRGTNVLTAMNGGNFTIQAQSAAPEPEIIEYVAPANTPAAPNITSSTHSDPDAWHDSNTAELSWTLPSGITGVRTLLDAQPTTIPTRVYEDPISSITLEDLDEGVSYFHLQFRNADGWGRVSHYRLAVDTENPTAIEISQLEDNDYANPIQTLNISVEDETSEVLRFRVKVDGDQPYEFIKQTATSSLVLDALEPGYHSVIIEAFDQAGNSVIGTYSFTVLAFDKPVFTDYPSEINEEVIPVIKGLTRPNATVDVIMRRVGGEPSVYSVSSDAGGVFTFIPEGTLYTGVYELTAQATDEYGAQSDLSDVVRIAVQQPGYVRIGGFIISVLSVIVPLVLLVFFLIIGTWYLFAYFRRFRKRVRVESAEALEILHREFSSLQNTLRNQEAAMQNARKTKKLTKAEAEMIETLDRALQESQRKVEKEIEDVNDLTKQNSN